jgi:polysaccharide export outer membrane protein
MQHKSITRYIISFILVMALVFMVVSLTSCMSSHRKDIEVFDKPDQLDVTCKSYVLQPPDEIEVRCEAVPEIDLQRQRIRPDGKIGFEGIGEIYVAGKTPSEVADLIKEKVLSLYTLTGDNPIDVRVVQFKSKVYYVLGQVDRPGPKDYTGRDTVLDAVAQAGLIPRSWEERTQVIRPSTQKGVKPKIFEINVDRMIAHGDASKNVLLQEGDIVFVPPTILGALGLMLEEALSPFKQVFSTVNEVYGAPPTR